MDFTLDSEHKALADAVREMASRRGARPSANGAGPRPHDPDLWSAMAETGLLGLPFREEAGGFGASAVEVFVAARELGRAGLQSAYADALLAGSVLADAGDDLLGSAVAGEALVLPALAEPMRAFAPVPGGVTATITGEGAVLSGTKGPVPTGAAATHAVVTARIDEEGAGGSTSGETVLVLLDGPRVENDVMVLDGASGRILLRGADADRALVDALAHASVVLAGQALGAMESAMTMTSDYLRTRKQFGVPLAAFQALTHRAADMYVSLELARSTAMYLAMSVAEGDTDPALVGRCRVVLARTGRHIGQEAIQLHGGIGVTAEYAVGHLTAMLTAIERTYGDPRQLLGRLAADVADYDTVGVLT
ncbi:acyl-CoA dehydrogenase [Nostocoides sp. F2B08]|uniref:acyl-CoA dehydrogenase family protein n=1 Tax=Nostocoides sp. F2B08 TaxID=2653936 RepID=UPI001262BB97|nr:acyl-CoA dehydrogenase family protein [Tetrasphaera sp. F2B08]KAB7744711.1 acyl-CoA dehydrogenase [Tetrasphaera sp. F2B08]